MTNGEKLCYMFPEMHYTLSEKQPRRVVTTIGVCASFDLEWWTAEYKEPTTKNEIRDNEVENELNQDKNELEPTTKNDLPHCQCTDAEIAKSFIEDVEAVKDQLPTTKNDLGVDCISRADARSLICDIDLKHHMFGMSRKVFKDLYNGMDELPPVTPKEPRWIPVSEKYEHHIDHTDCIWYGNDSGCPVTCSQYRDGWNDAMDYIFKNGDGYRPYRRNENG